MNKTDTQGYRPNSARGTLTRRSFVKTALGTAAGMALLNTGSRVWAAEKTAAVQTSAGKVTGLHEGGLNVFRGIPYAAPPVGERRWLPPQRTEAWSGVAGVDGRRPAAPGGDSWNREDTRTGEPGDPSDRGPHLDRGAAHLARLRGQRGPSRIHDRRLVRIRRF